MFISINWIKVEHITCIQLSQYYAAVNILSDYEIFWYSRSLLSADSRRAFVNFWQKKVHNIC